MSRLPLPASLLLLAACGRASDFEALAPALLVAPPAPKTFPVPTPTGEATVIEAHQGAVTGVAFLDSLRLVTVSYDDYRVVLWTTLLASPIAEAKHEHRPLSVAALPDGSGVFTTDAYGFLAFWPVSESGLGPPQILNPSTGRNDVDTIGKRLGHHARLAISPNGLLLATSSFDRLLTLWDLKTRSELRRFTAPRPLRAIAFAPDGRSLAVGGNDNTWTLWDLASGTGKIHVVSKVAATSDVSGIAFSRDGRRLATGHMDSSLTLWDPAAGKELGNTFVRNSSVYAVDFSADGSKLAVADAAGTVGVWDVATFTPGPPLQGLEGGALSLAFSPGGSLLAAGSQKGRLLIFR